MKKILKQVLGIDVAQKELVVSLGRMHEDLTPEIYAYKVFPNTLKGFSTLVDWVERRMDAAVKVRYVMEATGVYHESFAYYLAQRGLEVSIVLPNKISNYVRTLETKTITDKTSSQAIAMFGLERKLDLWKKPKAVYKMLKQLTRERDQVVHERTMAKNQLHAEQAEAEPLDSSLKRIKKRIAFLDKQEKEIQQEIAKVAKEDPQVSSSIKLIQSIPGVGLLTAVIVLAETNGFELIRNKRQLTNYAGLDVTDKQSGTSVRSKPRISKRGNRSLRKAMHLPALSAIGNSKRYKGIFARLVSKHGIKMKAVVAVQRKLLEMIYTIYKTKKVYDDNYLQIHSAETAMA
jgi:transposase